MKSHLLACALSALTMSCNLTPAQKAAVVSRVENAAIDLAACAIDGPGATALQTYLAHRLDADPAAVRADIANALHAGIGRDVVCALRALAGRRGQVGEGEVASGSRDPAVLLVRRAEECGDLKCPQTEGRAAAILMGMVRSKQVK